MRVLQEFFWTPVELIAWVRKVCSALGLWVVVWSVSEDAEPIDPRALEPEMHLAAIRRQNEVMEKLRGRFGQ